MNDLQTSKTLSPKGQARRELILNEACRLFAEKGYDAMTTKELAAAVGCSEALLFRYFPSKEAIYSTLFDEYCSILSLPFVLPRIQDETGLSWLKRFWQIHLSYKSSLGRKGLAAAVTSRVQKQDLLNSVNQTISDVVQDLVIPIFTQGQEDGSLPVRSPQRAACIFWCLLIGIDSRKFSYPQFLNPEFSFDDLVRAALCF